MKMLSETTQIKLATLVLLASLFAPKVAQAGGMPTTDASSGTVMLMNPASCPSDTSRATSVLAASVILVIDTESAKSQGDGATYIYFSETDTALWGADYGYGSMQEAYTCDYRDMNGTVTLSRGRFMASTNSAALSETNTSTTDFLQYVGNTQTSSVYSGPACGNIGVPHNTSNTSTSCTTAIQNTYSLLTYSTPLQVRDSNIKFGVLGQQSGTIHTYVKVLRSAIANAPAGTSWVAIETFTVMSS